MHTLLIDLMRLTKHFQQETLSTVPLRMHFETLQELCTIKKKNEAEVKNEAEQLVFQTEKSIKDLGDKISSEDKEKAEKQIKELKDAMEKDNIEDIKSKKDALQETAMAFATKVYEEAAKAKEANENNESNDSTNNDKKDDTVVDAEFEEK